LAKWKLDVDTDTRTSPTTTDPVWIPDLNLADSDRNLVRSGELNDKLVDDINTLMSSQLDRPTSSQTTLLAQSASGFNAVTSESVMILHGNPHWVTAAGTQDGVIMDSLRPHQQITAYVARQLLKLFATFVDA